MPLERVMISGGGTGGHIFPALALADQIKKAHPGGYIHFVGALGRMEMERVPRAGYPISGLWISGFQRKLSLQNLSFPFKLINSLFKARQLLRRHKPQLVIGTGGYASGPLLFLASRRGIPCLIQEQNSLPGITNRLLGRWVPTVAVAYPKMERYFPKSTVFLTGNPVRPALCAALPAAADAKKHFGLPPERPTLLILGGSLGARTINQWTQKLWPRWKDAGCNLIWQCGKLYRAALQAEVSEGPSEGLLLTDFLEDMSMAFGAADLVISRAGANTLSELAVVAKPAVLVPSPNVAENHQYHNARRLADDQAALLVTEEEGPEVMAQMTLELLASPERRQSLSGRLKAWARPQATEDIYQLALKTYRDA